MRDTASKGHQTKQDKQTTAKDRRSIAAMQGTESVKAAAVQVKHFSYRPIFKENVKLFFKRFVFLLFFTTLYFTINEC